MGILLIILALYVIGGLFEKTDLQKHREAAKLPSFTKKEAETYYYNEFKRKNLKK